MNFYRFIFFAIIAFIVLGIIIGSSGCSGNVYTGSNENELSFNKNGGDDCKGFIDDSMYDKMSKKWLIYCTSESLFFSVDTGMRCYWFELHEWDIQGIEYFNDRVEVVDTSMWLLNKFYSSKREEMSKW